MFPAIPIATALFYLGAIPFKFAFCLKIGAESGFHIGISIFESRFAIRKATQSSENTFHAPEFLQKLSFKSAFFSAKRMIRFLLRHLECFHLRGMLSTGDAAMTAWICGGISAIGYTLRGITDECVFVECTPDFSTGNFCMELHGMLSIRAGHIIIAALLGAFEYGSGRFKSWKNIPSKA